MIGNSHAAQFFPSDAKKSLTRVIKAFTGTPAGDIRPTWKELCSFFDSVAFGPAKNQEICVELGNVNYRLGFTIPGIVIAPNHKSPDFDLQKFAELADAEEDVVTIKWKKGVEIITELGQEPADLISNIPYPENETDHCTLSWPKLTSYFPRIESRVNIAISNNNVFIQRRIKPLNIISKSPYLNPELSSDYYLGCVLPPRAIFDQEAITIKVSNEGILFEQGALSLYTAASPSTEEEFQIPNGESMPIPIESIEIVPSPEQSVINIDHNAIAISDKEKTIKLTGDKIKPQKAITLPKVFKTEDLLDIREAPETEIAVCQFNNTHPETLLAIENEYTSLYINMAAET